MRKRTRARELVLQLLYQADLMNISAKDLMADFFGMVLKEGDDSQIEDFARQLINDIWDNISSIDKKISEYATNWQLSRMAIVDRNILRLGSYELLFRDDIPPKVTINEAVELAKKYGDLESGKFVNGVLDKINKTKNQSGSAI